MKVTEFLSLLPSPKKSGSGWIARCPAHDDAKASLSIRQGKDGKILLHCHAGCPLENIVAALGLKTSDLFPKQSDPTAKPRGRIIGTYNYEDEDGKLLFQCVRFEPKDFRQRHPDPRQPRKWLWNLQSVRRV